MQSHSPTRWLCSLLCLSALAFGQPPQRIYAAHLVSKVEPVYPPVAKKNGIHGTVRLDVTIGKDGHVAKLATAHGHDGIGSPASRRTPAPPPSARGWSSSSKPAPEPPRLPSFPVPGRGRSAGRQTTKRPAGDSIRAGSHGKPDLPEHIAHYEAYA